MAELRVICTRRRAENTIFYPSGLLHPDSSSQSRSARTV